jgi:peroxiredoxin
MAQLHQDYNRFVEQGAEIIVIGPEGRQAFADYWQKEKLPFVGLPDPKHTILKLYGQQVNLFKLGRMPAQVVIDRAGRARFVHYGHSMSDIPPNDEVLGLLDGLNSQGEPD